MLSADIPRDRPRARVRDRDIIIAEPSIFPRRALGMHGKWYLGGKIRPRGVGDIIFNFNEEDSVTVVINYVESLRALWLLRTRYHYQRVTFEKAELSSDITHRSSRPVCKNH